MFASSTTNIVLYSLVILVISVGCLMSTMVFITMCFRRGIVKRHRIDYLLLGNTYLILITVCPFFLDLSIHSIYGHLHPDSTFEGFPCRFKAYIMYINGYVYFYSFLLQAIYRYCRIVYHTQLKYQSFRLYFLLSIFLWINGFWQTVPCLIFRHVDYMPDEYHCQFPADNLPSSLIGLSIMFLVPYLLTLMCYACTMYHVRKRTTELSHINQRASLRRDLTVLTRIVFLLTLVTLVAMPHVLIPIIYVLFGYIPPWASPFEWLLTVLGLFGAGFLQLFLSPIMRQLFARRVMHKSTNRTRA